ncbi:MAG: hypothetical protein R3E66_12325 [bacterium]
MNRIGVESLRVKLDNLAIKLLLLSIVVAPVALGGVHRVVVMALFVLVATAALASVVAQSATTSARFSASFAACALVACFAGFQLIPLPADMLRLITPYFWDLWQASLKAVGVESSWHAISAQPGATADRVLRFATLALATLAAANLRDREATRKQITWAFGAGIVLSLLVGLAHRFADITVFFGVYDPGVAPKMTTFISSNHAASVFGLAALLSGLFTWRAVRNQQRNSAVNSALSLLAALIIVFEANSVGVLALLGVIAVLVLAMELAPWRKHALAAVSVGVVAAMALVAKLGLPDSLAVRVELNRATLAASTHAWLTGFGAGATETTLPPFVRWQLVPDARLVTIETEPIEWLMTLGWPVAIVVIALFATYLVPAKVDDASHRREFFQVATWAVGLYVAGIAMMHFPFLALGVSLPMLLVLESFQRQVFQRHHAEPKRPHPRAYPFLDVSNRTLGIAAGLMIALGTVGFVLSSAPQGDLALQIAQTPGNAMLFADAARTSLHNDPVKAEQLAKRAVELEPTARMKLLYATTLAANKRGEEAVAIYREVGTSYLGERAAKEAAMVLPPSLSARAIVRPEYWRAARDTALKHRGRSAAIDFVLALVDANPDSAMAARVAIEAYWQRKEYGVAELWCELLIAQGRTDEHGNPIGPGLLVETLLKANRVDEARQRANQALTSVPNDATVAQVVLRLRTAEPKRADAEEVSRVETAHKTFCGASRTGPQRMLCDVARAWLAEARNDDAAEDILKGVAERFNQPTPLAEYYVRTNKCAALRTLSVHWRDRPEGARAMELANRCGALP